MAITMTDEESGLRHAIEKHFGGISLELMAFDNLLKKAYSNETTNHCCPRCQNTDLSTEGCDDGYTQCVECGYRDEHYRFYN